MKPRKLLILYGAGGGSRTHTELPPPDFESGASANSTTPAISVFSKKKRIWNSIEYHKNLIPVTFMSCWLVRQAYGGPVQHLSIQFRTSQKDSRQAGMTINVVLLMNSLVVAEDLFFLFL
jgi:hypothetical protein